MQPIRLDFLNLKPIILINSFEEQNDFTFTLKNRNNTLSISTPGYNQKDPISLLTLDIDNSFIAARYTSNERNSNLMISPKFGNYPIKLRLYPYQNMNYKLSSNSFIPIPTDNGSPSSFILPFSVDSFKRKVDFSPSFQLFQNDISFSFSLFAGLPSYLGAAWTLGNKPILVGVHFHKKFKTKEYLEAIFQYKNKQYDIRIMPKIRQLIYFGCLKGLISFNHETFNTSMSFKFKKVDDFLISSLFAYSDKSIEFQLAPKKFRCTLGCDLTSQVSGKLGFTFGPFFGREDPPSIKAHLIFHDE